MNYLSQKAKQNPKQLAHEDPDLAELIGAWSALPDAIKAGIIAMVRAVINSEKLA